MPGSLPDELFDPLQLDEVLTRAHTIGGMPAVTELLERVLDDPRSHWDERESVYLDELIERYEDAVAVAYRMLDRAEPWERPRIFAQIAQLHLDNDEPTACRAVLNRAATETVVRSNRGLVLSAFVELASILEKRLEDPKAAIDLIERVLDAAKRRCGRDRTDLDCLAQLHREIATRAGLATPDQSPEDSNDDSADQPLPAVNWWSEVIRIYPGPHPEGPADSALWRDTAKSAPPSEGALSRVAARSARSLRLWGCNHP